MNKKIKNSLVFHNCDIKLGFHITKEKNLLQSFENHVYNTPLRSYQIYVANSRSKQSAKLNIEDILETKKLLENNNKYACIHGSLTHNLAGAVNHRDDPNYERKLNSTCVNATKELDLGVGFNAGVVIHIGSCVKKQKGIFTISKSIESILTRNTQEAKQISKALNISLDEFKKKRKIILENSAGEGNKIGKTLNEIAEIINMVDENIRNQVKVCIDTQHIFGAGQYDFGLKKDVNRFFSDFDDKIGLDKLELFHLNDSRVKYDNKRDRHENLGLGYIFSNEEYGFRDTDGLKGLKKLVDISEEHKIPLIGEPPAKNLEGSKCKKCKHPEHQGLGGIWDYNIIKHLTNLEEEHFVCE